jgi:hypothetical protein
VQADWEFEVGGDAPLIEFPWSGFVDLAADPERVLELAEIADFPALADALVVINSAVSPVWTSKCDVWVPALDEVDVDELDTDGPDTDELGAGVGSVLHALGCYVDLIPRNDKQWSTPELIESDCRQWCGSLQAIPLGSCGVNFVIRRLVGESDALSLGITAYLAACGRSPGEARTVMEKELAAFAQVLCAESKLQ